ncbi:hypothetical protein RUM43_014652 [Polyplax serrata]|uniref:Ig-like domain-containing protein n=1 Tax=Polyplax serrata TaxID=468196 RepID=A0AAN8PGW9_POLSC
MAQMPARQCWCAPPSGAQLDLQGPIFLYEPPRRVEFSNTSGGKVDCQAHGVPLPVLEWILADGTTVTQIKDVRLISGNGSLIFPPFPAEKFRRDVHASVYRCIARNRVGLILSTDVFVKAEIEYHISLGWKENGWVFAAG